MLACRASPDEVALAVAQRFDISLDARSAAGGGGGGGGTTTRVAMPVLPPTFGIGLLLGPSGSGKSTILAALGRRGYRVARRPEWHPERSVAWHFGDAETAAERLVALGLCSVPAWLRPYATLSNGEQHRADVARGLASHAAFDEFTSCVDRDTAASMCAAVGRHVRRRGLSNVVFASCHADIVPFLRPDWVHLTEGGATVAGPGAAPRPGAGPGAAPGGYAVHTRMLVRRPPRADDPPPARPFPVLEDCRAGAGDGLARPVRIDVDVVPCGRDVWDLVCAHHYLSHTIHGSCTCYAAFLRRSDQPGPPRRPADATPPGALCGFVAVLPAPGYPRHEKSGLAPRREHRLVVLPKYQGLGVGTQLSETVARLYVAGGHRYFSRTTHPKLGAQRDASPLWRATSGNHRAYDARWPRGDDTHVQTDEHAHRLCFSHEFVGP